MVGSNNIWQIAEDWLSGSMSETDAAALKVKMETDAAFANEFQETINVISSFEGSGRQKRFRTMLRDIHDKQATQAQPKKAKQILFTPQLWRTAAVAATVALFISTLTFWGLKSADKHTDAQYNTISREVDHIKKVQALQQAEQNKLKADITKNNKQTPPVSEAKYTGTGFAVTNDGYIVTAWHVINDGKGAYDSVYVQTHDGQYYKANLVNFSAEHDVAILKVEKKGFRFAKGDVPYTFSTAKAGLGSDIFTLGYKDDITTQYSKGYISSRNGYDDNHMQYTLVLPVGHGQSGSPVVDDKGNILALLTAVGAEAEANTYAVSTKAIVDLVQAKIPDDKSFHLPKANKLGHITRQQMVEKIETYTVSVKVYKK